MMPLHPVMPDNSLDSNGGKTFQEAVEFKAKFSFRIDDDLIFHYEGGMLGL